MFGSPASRAGRGESIGFQSKLLDRIFGNVKGSLLVRGSDRWRKFAIGADGTIVVADSTQSLGLKWGTLTAGGVSTGKDRNRPAASTAAIYITTDTNQTYLSDGTNWHLPGGIGDKAIATAFNSTNYLIAAGVGTANGGPTMSASRTCVIGFRCDTLPGTNRHILVCNAAPTTFVGWYLRVSNTNSNKFVLWLNGTNSSAEIELNSMATLTTGAHSFAVTWDGTTVGYCLDGGTVNTKTPGGTYTGPNASTATYTIGLDANLGNAASDFSIAYVQSYASVVSNADLQTLTGSPSTYLPGNISTDPEYDWQARWNASGLNLPVYGSSAPANGSGTLIKHNNCYTGVGT